MRRRNRRLFLGTEPMRTGDLEMAALPENAALAQTRVLRLADAPTAAPGRHPAFCIAASPPGLVVPADTPDEQ